MPWGKMDDKFHRNRKVRTLRKMPGGREALGVWTYWWSWCLDDPELTGVVPRDELPEADVAAANLLVEVELWDLVSEGYKFHDFNDYNPTKDQVEAKRAADRERMARLRSGASRERVADDVASDSESTSSGPPERVASTRDPVPTHPNPTDQEKEERRTSSPRTRALVDPEVLQVAAHYRSKLSPRASWKLDGTHNRVSRAVAVRKRLDEGYTVADLCRAVDGLAGSEWHRSNGEVDLGLAMAKVDKFIAMAGTPPRSGVAPLPAPTGTLTLERAAELAEDNPQWVKDLEAAAANGVGK